MWKFYDPKTKSTHVSRDVVFYEQERYFRHNAIDGGKHGDEVVRFRGVTGYRETFEDTDSGSSSDSEPDNPAVPAPPIPNVESSSDSEDDTDIEDTIHLAPPAVQNTATTMSTSTSAQSNRATSIDRELQSNLGPAWSIPAAGSKRQT